MLETYRRRATERRARLWNPPNGRLSSDLEVLSKAGLRERQRQEERDRGRRLSIIARGRNVFKFKLLKDKLTKLSTDVHKHQQPVPDEPPLIDETCVWPLTIRDICRACCRHFRINMIDFISRRRHAELVRARHVAMYLARSHTARTFPEIAQIMGGRDHTTILHGDRSIRRKLATNEALAEDVAAIRKMLSIEEALQ